MIALTLPFPPSANAYIRHSQGMHFPTKKAKQFRKDVWAIVKAANITPMHCRLHVELLICAPTRAKRDISNYEKPTMDALQCAGAFIDDEQVDRMVLDRGPILRGGAVKVLIQAHAVQHVEPQQIPLPVPKVPSAKELDDARIDALIPFEVRA